MAARLTTVPEIPVGYHPVMLELSRARAVLHLLQHLDQGDVAALYHGVPDAETENYTDWWRSMCYDTLHQALTDAGAAFVKDKQPPAAEEGA